MGVIEWSRSRLSLVVFVAVAVALMVGCATTPTSVWPDVDVAAESPPESVDGEPRLIRGSSGLLYASGDFENSPEVGQTVLGRHDGNWPLQETPRPALFVGEVARVVSESLVLVHPLYQFPDVKTAELRVEITDGLGDETMGKGIATIESVDFSGPSDLELSLGGQSGVQRGDMYGILAPRSGENARSSSQLTRRLLGICMVVELDRETSSCRLWQGHPDYPWAGQIQADQQVLFLEPTFATSPRKGRILVSEVEDDEVNQWIKSHLENYFNRFPNGEVELEFFEEAVDATDTNFHRWNRRIETDEPAILMGATIVERDGHQHLHLNYTGLGPAVGPGMVAAPPEGGVDMGRVDQMSTDDWHGIAAVLMGAMMVYRGQTSTALMHMHDALRHPAVSGQWRWHLRDQYAMRWGALNRFEEAMWLVREDEAVARQNNDEKAYLNALGTRVRLHDFLEQPREARLAAQEYLEARLDDRPEGGYLSALAMFAEMAMNDGEVEEVRAALAEMEELCPDGCGGDMIPLLAGIYWASFGSDDGLQEGIVQRMVELARTQDASSMASARMFQGWNYLREGDLEQSLIAFLEAQRLFQVEKSEYGAARAQIYLAWTQIEREEPQQAFEQAVEALEFMTSIGDYGTTVRIYERLSQIYMAIDPSLRPQPYIGSATRVLQNSIQRQLSMGDYGGAAEAGLAYGQFLFSFRQFDEAQSILQRSVGYGLRAAKFDSVAISHLLLALIARAQGNMELFEAEVSRAQLMADAAESPFIDELIENTLSPQREAEDPTQLL